jgi:TPR repeat protein
MRVSILLPLVAWLTVSGASVRADMADALAAFDAGDYAAAFEAWRALAEAGEVEAQVALAGLYLAGQGTGRDAAAALRWYRRAAEQGDAVAQQNLGDLLSRGVGAAPDPVSAYVWLSLAAAQGRRWPARRRDVIAQEMTPEQRAEAEARLMAWRESH